MKKTLLFTFLFFARHFRGLLSHRDETYKLLFLPGFENFRWMIGKWKALRVFEEAKKRTPAYKKFLKQHSNAVVSLNGWDPDFSRIPITNKKNYVKTYSLAERCLDGIIPPRGVVIDESSGTSGLPNNWVRGPKEREDVKKILQLALHNHFGDTPIFILNAFALGPWATGMNVSMSLVDVAMLKSVGPDAKKIENTLKLFGPSYNYIIMGYPPFLKSLIDTIDIPWKDYNIAIVFGGEGMSEGMRTYLQNVFHPIYGSYGASDLEINIGAENDFTIALRKLLMKNEKLAKQIVQHNSLPMIFQYNPLDYYIETNDEGELIVTLTRLANVAPKVRYNIHDLGHVLRFPELQSILRSCNLELSDIHKQYVDLPLLFHYGRSDMAVAFYGCKITPSDIQEVIYSIPMLSKSINSFALLMQEDEKANKTLTLGLEIREDKQKLQREKKEYREMIFTKLAELNQDFRESSHMIPKGFEPDIAFFNQGEGPFAADDIRLKKHYIQIKN